MRTEGGAAGSVLRALSGMWERSANVSAVSAGAADTGAGSSLVLGPEGGRRTQPLRRKLDLPVTGQSTAVFFSEQGGTQRGKGSRADSPTTDRESTRCTALGTPDGEARAGVSRGRFLLMETAVVWRSNPSSSQLGDDRERK